MYVYMCICIYNIYIYISFVFLIIFFVVFYVVCKMCKSFNRKKTLQKSPAIGDDPLSHCKCHR